MGRTWWIFGRICWPCGRNLSSVDKCDLCDPKFSGWNKLWKSAKTSKTRSCLVIKGKLLLQTYHTGKHFTGLLFSEPNAFQLFVFFICPILPKLEIEENNTSTNGQTKKRKCFLVSGLLQFSMWQRQLTPTNATLFGWTKSFLFRLRFGSFVLF